MIFRRRLAAFAIPALVALLFACASATVSRAAAPNPSPWDRVRFFLGSWTGVGEGRPGRSTIEREYRFTLRDRFIEVRNTSIYPPQEKNARGETHEDRGFISWDRARSRFVFRQFHVEGFVNHYVADSLGSSADSIVFTSEAIENIPAGYRARETCRILGPDEFVERFELAEPDSAFTLYSQATFRRKR